MAETRTIFDPFDKKTVEIRNDLVLRLRGKYASGPTLSNGEPEFGWRQFDTPPIQHEAADAIERMESEIKSLGTRVKNLSCALESVKHSAEYCDTLGDIIDAALSSGQRTEG